MSYYVLVFQYGHVEEMAGLEGVEGCMEPLAVLSSASLGRPASNFLAPALALDA